MGEVQSALAFHPLPVMEESGGDAPASSDADQGKQQLWSPTFLLIPIFPNYCLSEPVVVQKTYANASISRAVMGGAQFPIWTIDRQHNDRAQSLYRII